MVDLEWNQEILKGCEMKAIEYELGKKKKKERMRLRFFDV